MIQMILEHRTFLFSLLLIVVGLMFIPAVRKAGFSGWWVVLAVVPGINLIAPWLFALVRWPNHPRR